MTPSPNPVLRKSAPLALSMAATVALFYLTFYLPLAAVTYTSPWHKWNCHVHERCEILGLERSYLSIDQLRAYLLHRAPLEARYGWSEKERTHLAEVRVILDAVFFGALSAAALLALTWRPRRIARAALVNLGLLVALACILPFFKTFWREVFHPLLFDNDLWKNNRGDISWYLMPRVFFFNSSLLILGLAGLLNALVWWLHRGRGEQPPG